METTFDYCAYVVHHITLICCDVGYVVMIHEVVLIGG